MSEIIEQQSRKARNSLPGSGVTPAHYFVGIVTSISADAVSVSSGSSVVITRKASSCLLDTAVGDTVACISTVPQDAWVIAVLQREDNTTSKIRLDRPTTIHLDGGSLRFEVDTVDFDTRTFAVRSDETEWVTKEFRLIGNLVKLVGATFRAVFEQSSSYFKQYLRTTEGVDKVSASHAEIEAKQLLRVSGDHTLIEGTKLVKARGAQIHFG